MMTLALSAGLLGGCSTTSPSGSRVQVKRAGAPPAKRVSQKAEADSEIPVDSLAHFAVAFSHDLNGRPELALEEYCQAALANPAYEALVTEAARRCLRQKKPERAVEILSKATANPWASGTVYAWLGMAYGQSGQNDLAIAASRTAIKKMPLALAAYQNLTQIYLQKSQTNEALRVLDDAARQSGTDAGFLLDLADLYTRVGRIQLAKNASTNVTRSGPSLSSDRKRPPKNEDTRAKVWTLLERAAKLGSKNPLVLNKLGDGYLQMGETNKAEIAYLQLLKIYPEMAIVRGKLADLYLRRGEKEKASQQLEAIAKEDPTNPRTQSFLGAIALEESKYKEAEEYFERALLLNPELEPVYYDLVGIKLTLKKPEEALALLEKVRAKFKIGFAMEFYSAIAQVLRKNYPEALKYFTSAEVLAKANEPSRLNHVFYYQVGSAHERAGNHDQAEKCFQKCLELSPDYADAMNYLGYMWTELGIKLDQARTLIEKAVELEPKNPAFLDSLGWVLFKLNQPKEALAWLLKAVESSPEPDPTLYDHLGDIHAALKEFRQAREAWRKSLSVEPNEQIKRKLETAPPSEPSAQ